jgi:hypothetical protein
MRLASWVIDAAVACGYINAKYIGIERTSDCLHAKWIDKLIDELIEKAGITISNNIANTPAIVHYPVHLGEKKDRKMCVVCWKNDKKNITTYYKCNQCVGLCVNKSCFAEYHTQ